ncbi:MAG TPA: threonine aldolase [Sphingobacteriaceae bacterium]|nr:threonine aldolase [Sphingobacteriaceae bacterium]
MIVDLRSDTVTKPSPGMLDAMLSAKVGDDVFEEDETVNALEAKTAGIFGMEAGLFCPSGTMTNQIAIKSLTQPMDEVIVDETAHVYRSEAGGIAFNSGASVRLLHGDRGRINPELIEPYINPENVHLAKTSLVVIENTVNFGGGSYYTLNQIEPIFHLCKLKNLYLHLDGARIFNALTETGDQSKKYGHFFDTISVCLSKGLGAPVGSVMLGGTELINKARRIRKVLGGGMRQAGFLAAAGIYALDNNVKRLKDDHQHAKAIAEALKGQLYVKSIMPVDTNIIIFELTDHYKAEDFIRKLNAKGIRCLEFGRQKIRFVTHLDVTQEMVDHTIDTLRHYK